jgi:hypothetical protein
MVPREDGFSDVETAENAGFVGRPAPHFQKNVG